MRGPSSSHTAGSYRIGQLSRMLLDEKPKSVNVTFDPKGSYAATYRPQGVDLAFALGILDIPLEDKRFFTALDEAKNQDVDLHFHVAPLDKPDHPNTAYIKMSGQKGRSLTLTARSIGGGLIEIVEMNNGSIQIDGKSFNMLFSTNDKHNPRIEEWVPTQIQDGVQIVTMDNQLINLRSQFPLPSRLIDDLNELGITDIYQTQPVFFPMRGNAQIQSSSDILDMAQKDNSTLGAIGVDYESTILGISQRECNEEMLRRWLIMKKSVTGGLDGAGNDMLLLEPTADKILAADSENRLAIGGLHSRAAAYAMAAMHVANSRGIVCAAPTGGSAGVLPGTFLALAETRNLNDADIIRGLFAAGIVGLMIASRSGFAAETAGCQVEIGAAGAMASAAVVEVYGGTAEQSMNAAAISLQNTMGSVCDNVYGTCEIPCHTRNGVAASNAYVCADLILGGYKNPIPLDETIDASKSVGEMLPRELRCTAMGGIATTPSAKNMKPRR